MSTQGQMKEKCDFVIPDNCDLETLKPAISSGNDYIPGDDEESYSLRLCKKRGRQKSWKH